MTIQELVMKLATEISQLTSLLELYKHPAIDANCKVSILALGIQLSHSIHVTAEALETATRNVGN